MTVYDILKKQVANNNRSIFNGMFLAVAAFIRLFTTDENDRNIRAEMDELTPAERRAAKQADRENYNAHMRSAAFYADSETFINYDNEREGV